MTSFLQFTAPGTPFDGFILSVTLPKPLEEGDVIDLNQFVGLLNLDDTQYQAISQIQWEVASIDVQPAYKVYLKPTNLDALGNLVYEDIC
jgi:hypothetical protein